MEKGDVEVDYVVGTDPRPVLGKSETEREECDD
jgi:hypothetical protein